MIHDNFKFVDVALGGAVQRNNLVEVNKLHDHARVWKRTHDKYIDCYRTYFRYPIGI